MKKTWLIILALFIIACGRKAPPLPVEKSIPKDYSLTVEATPLGFNLWIDLPTTTQGGYPLNKIKALIIEKEEIPLQNPSKSKKRILKLTPKLHSAGNLFMYTDSEVKPGFAYRYRVKIKKDFLVETPFSNEITVFWTTPPLPPQNVKLVLSTPEEIRLTWDAPLLNLNQEPLKGEIFYRIERIKGAEIKIHNVRERIFKDYPHKERICYRLYTMLNFYETIIPSPSSELICYP